MGITQHETISTGTNISRQQPIVIPNSSHQSIETHDNSIAQLSSPPNTN